MTEIVIQVRSEANGEHAPEVLEDAFGLRLEPLFRGSADAAMRSWFRLTLPVDIDPDNVVSDLVGHPAVESAYVKPPESVP